jgi:hypothetical protein
MCVHSFWLADSTHNINDIFYLRHGKDKVLEAFGTLLFTPLLAQLPIIIRVPKLNQDTDNQSIFNKIFEAYTVTQSKSIAFYPLVRTSKYFQDLRVDKIIS